MVEGLNFPRFDKPLPEAKSLTMNEYLKFVRRNLTYIKDPEVYRTRKKDEAVTERFYLR